MARAAVSPRWTYPLLLFLAVRAALMAASSIGLTLVPALYEHSSGRSRTLMAHPWLDGLCRWDCGLFERIVAFGFRDVESAQVFPLYPMLARIVSWTGLYRLYALLAVSNAASLASYYAVYQAFRVVEGEQAARKGLLLLVAFPFHFFQAAAYADSSMVLFTAAALLLALRGRHVWAGVALGFGVLTRHIALCAGAGMLVAQIRQRGIRPSRFFGHPAILGLALPFLFLLAWSAYLDTVFVAPAVLLKARLASYWHEKSFWGVAEVLANVPYAQHPEYYFYMLLSLIPLAGAIAGTMRTRWLEFGVSALVLMLVCFGSGAIGLGRYAGTCWPAFLPLGVWAARRPGTADAIAAVCFLFQGLFFFLFSHQFAIL